MSIDSFELAILRQMLLPDFHDLQRCRDGRWKATHQATQRTVEAGTLEQLVKVEAPLARIAPAGDPT